MNEAHTQKLLILRKKFQPPKQSNSLSLQNELFEAQKSQGHTHGSDPQFCLLYAWMMYNLDLNMSVSDGSKFRLCKILSLCLFDKQMNQMNSVGAHKCSVTHTKFCYLCPYIFLLRNQVMYVYIPFQGRLYYISLTVDICFNYILDATEIRHTCVSVTPVSLNIVILSVKWALMSSKQCQ